MKLIFYYSVISGGGCSGEGLQCKFTRLFKFRPHRCRKLCALYKACSVHWYL